MRIFELDHACGSQCQAEDIRHHTYPKHGVTRIRCGGYAVRGVTWQGRVEGEHTLLVCQGHLLERFVAPAIAGEGYDDPCPEEAHAAQAIRKELAS